MKTNMFMNERGDAYKRYEFNELTKKMKFIKLCRKKIAIGNFLTVLSLGVSVIIAFVFDLKGIALFGIIPAFSAHCYAASYDIMLDSSENQMTESELEFMRSMTEKMPKKKER